MGAGIGRRAPVPPTPLKIFPVKEKPVKTLLLLCFCRPRFPGCCRESDKVCRQGLASAWQAGQPYSLPARRSRKLLPRPEALQVAELGQSPVGEKGLPRGSKCWTGVVAASEAYKTGWRPCIVEVENSWPGQWPMATLSPGNVLSHSSQSGGQASPCDL